ncbi:MAG: c-type cytochrome [Pyrinomonadaceae bacterium]
MKTKIKIIAVAFFLVFGAVFLGIKGKTQTKVETAGEKFKNIKVLNDMPADQMGQVMNLMAASLNVNCKFCHVSNDADFEKDGNEHKDIAREMIKMTFELNKNHFENRPEISCNTCHKGHSHPQSGIDLDPALPQPPRPQRPDKMPTVEEVLAKYETALGGKDNLGKITSRQIKAQRLEPDGKTLEEEEVWQKSDKLVVATKYPDYLVTEGFDGKNVWKTGNLDRIELKPDESEQIKREAQIFANPELKTVYPKMEVRFVDRIDGREVWVVTASTADNKRERLFFDRQTGLLVRRIAATPTVLGFFAFQVDYKDYKDFGGVKLPTQTRFAVPNISWTRKVLEVKLNPGIDDSKFKTSGK